VFVIRNLRRFFANDVAMTLAAFLAFVVMGYASLPLWLAVIGGALLVTPSMVELMLLWRRQAVVPTNRGLISFCAEALGNGVCGAVAGFFIGYGIHAYFGQ
jgi:hypothetical protein